jgi:fatty-acyl-CoA synthase
MEDFEERHGVRIYQAWGMTETSPLCTIARPSEDEGEQHWAQRSTAGRTVPWVELRLAADAGEDGARSANHSGEIEVRGPWVAASYYADPSGDDKFDDGWLRTGDIAEVDAEGFVRITDRSKDVIKSGGEWISSLEMESHLICHPDVLEVAVIAQPDERWSERPLPCVVLREGAATTPQELRDHLLARVPRWWVPDEFVFIDAVPRTGVGKFDKKLLRRRLRDGELRPQAPSGPTAPA